jgi:protein-L-isoaspartate(D-aspartate) O-methyltransferase
MVDQQLARRGIADRRVLDAFRKVPREDFLPTDLQEFAYQDSPLPIGNDQTISQPYIVALTTEALKLTGNERVLEIGTGSGYAAAILAQVVKSVVSVERIAALATTAQDRLQRLGYGNVQVICADGTLGWPQGAPYDAIAVAAGGPQVPSALLSQLALGGRLVIPVGADESSQVLLRVTRKGPADFHTEDLTPVRFVPLIGEQGWADTNVSRAPTKASSDSTLAKLVAEVAEPIADFESPSIARLIDRIGDARIVLLGESTHGSSEFYRMRARITQELIEKRGFDFVAVEADWPDAARIDAHVVGNNRPAGPQFAPFSRFPTWMWRNTEVADFVSWLRQRNLAERDVSRRVGFHGLDLYSMFTSIAAVLAYLNEVDPNAARVAKARYGELTPWQRDPAAYGRAVLTGRYASSEDAVVAMLQELLERRFEYARKDGDRFFDAVQNARVVANAERYYRAMYYGSAASWNLRDTHMFDTLEALLGFYGPNSRGVVWEHNSHVGDATATEMSARGELNIGQLCCEKYADRAYAIGFSTDHGTVAAASDWDEPMQVMRVRPARGDSYESVLHASQIPAFILPLRDPRRRAVRDELMVERLERAIGVVYRPATELQSHYFHAVLPRQFDDYLWLDQTRAVRPITDAEARGLPRAHPFAPYGPP